MVNKPMKKACGLYTIDIIVTKKDGLWRANVWIGPILEIPKALRDMGDLEGHKSRREAEDAGVRWGKERIDVYTKKSRQARRPGALGLIDANSRKELDQAELESDPAATRAKSYADTIKDAEAVLAALDTAKVTTHQTADDIGSRALELKELFSVNLRENFRELVDTARLAGLDSTRYNRLQDWANDWLMAQLFSNIKIPKALDRPLGELIADFLDHRGATEANDEKAVA